MSARICSSASCSAIFSAIFGPDARRGLDLLGRGGQQRVDRAELLGEVAPGDVADLLEADREEHAPEAAVLGRRDVGHRALGADLARALELGELLDGEAVEVAGGPDQARLLELGDLLLAQPSMSIAPRETKCLSSCQRRSGQSRLGHLVKTSPSTLTVSVLQNGQRFGRPRDGGRFLASTTCGAGESDLRDDVAGAQDDDVLARAEVLADDVLLVVQRRELDRDARRRGRARARRTGAGRRTCRRSTARRSGA
jgi:hypothetical protein